MFGAGENPDIHRDRPSAAEAFDGPEPSRPILDGPGERASVQSAVLSSGKRNEGSEIRQFERLADHAEGPRLRAREIISLAVFIFLLMHSWLSSPLDRAVISRTVIRGRLVTQPEWPSTVRL